LRYGQNLEGSKLVLRLAFFKIFSVYSHIEGKDLSVRKKLMKGFIWSTDTYGDES